MNAFSKKDRDELNSAILQYLKANGYSNSEEMFQTEAEITPSDLPKTKNLLEMKWKSVIRLQKQVMDLEKKIQQLKEESNPATFIELAGKAKDGLPKQSEKFICLGH